MDAFEEKRYSLAKTDVADVFDNRKRWIQLIIQKQNSDKTETKTEHNEVIQEKNSGRMTAA